MPARTLLFVLATTAGVTAQIPWTWVQRRPATAPPPRGAHAMVHDTSRNRVVLFGGTLSSTQGRNDTWEWDGSQWQQHVVAGPPARWHHAMAFDAARGRTVLFGGAPGPLADTWEWDGTRWQQMYPTVSPPAATRHMMAYDPARARTVLYGGGTGTWLWDGVNWQPTQDPLPPRNAGAMTATATGIVLFGGEAGVPLADSWQWTGTRWSPLPAAPAPTARSSHALAAHGGGDLVLFGGDQGGGAVLGDTWLRDASGWTRLAVQGPSPRRFHALVYQPLRGAWLFFGGDAPPGATGHNWQDDTWELTPGAVTLVAPGCPGNAGIPGIQVDLPPRSGFGFELQLERVPGQTVGLLVLGDLATPQPLPSPGCLLHVAPVAVCHLAPGGHWSVPLVPAQLVGSALGLQAVFIDPIGPQVIASDALQAIVGW